MAVSFKAEHSVRCRQPLSTSYVVFDHRQRQLWFVAHSAL